MKDELVDKCSLVTSVLDQKAAEAEAEGRTVDAEAKRKLAESFAEAGNAFRRIAETIEERRKLLDNFAFPFKRDKGRFPTLKEQEEEMERLGHMKDGKWIK